MPTQGKKRLGPLATASSPMRGLLQPHQKKTQNPEKLENILKIPKYHLDPWPRHSHRSAAIAPTPKEDPESWEIRKHPENL